MKMIKNVFWIKYLENFEIVSKNFQICQWNTALWEKGKRYWCIKFALNAQARYITDFWIKKNDILRLFECFQLSESTACWHKNRCDRIVALCILLKKRLSYPYRCKDVLPLFGRNSSSFTFNFIYQCHHHRLELRNLHSLQPPYLQKYAAAVTGKRAPLYNCFDLLVEQLLVFAYRF